MKTYIKKLIVLAATTGIALSASATPTLWLWQDWGAGNTVIVADGSALDTMANANQVAYQGAVGDWYINFTAGILTGTASQPEMDLSSVNFSSKASTLWVGFSADGFGPSPGSATASIGGTTDGAIEYWSGLGTLNQSLPAAFDYPNPFLAFGSLPGTNNQSFSGSDSWMLNQEGTYSLVQWVKITHSGAGNSSFNATLSVPDSGSTALLIVLGLIGIGFTARRNKQPLA